MPKPQRTVDDFEADEPEKPVDDFEPDLAPSALPPDSSPAPPEERAHTGPGEAITSGFVENVPFGQRLYAAARGAAGAINRSAPGRWINEKLGLDGTTTTYEKALEQERRLNAQTIEDHPYLHALGGAAGTIGSAALLPTGGIGKAVTWGEAGVKGLQMGLNAAGQAELQSVGASRRDLTKGGEFIAAAKEGISSAAVAGVLGTTFGLFGSKLMGSKAVKDEIEKRLPDLFKKTDAALGPDKVPVQDLLDRLSNEAMNNKGPQHDALRRALQKTIERIESSDWFEKGAKVGTTELHDLMKTAPPAARKTVSNFIEDQIATAARKDPKAMALVLQDFQHLNERLMSKIPQNETYPLGKWSNRLAKAARVTGKIEPVGQGSAAGMGQQIAGQPDVREAASKLDEELQRRLKAVE